MDLLITNQELLFGTMEQDAQVVARDAEFAADFIFVAFFEEDGAQDLLVLFGQTAQHLAHQIPDFLAGGKSFRVGGLIFIYGLAGKALQRFIARTRAIGLVQNVVANRADEGAQALGATNSISGTDCGQDPGEGFLADIIDLFRREEAAAQPGAEKLAEIRNKMGFSPAVALAKSAEIVFVERLDRCKLRGGHGVSSNEQVYSRVLVLCSKDAQLWNFPVTAQKIFLLGELAQCARIRCLFHPMREAGTSMKPVRKLLVLLYLALLLSAAGAAAGHPPAAATQADHILIIKSTRTMTLLRQGRVLKTYKVALGAEPVGAKTRRGDNRTPEGSYTIDSRNAYSQFHLALHISYPNAADRERAKRLGVSPGGDIMIHGLPRQWAWLGAAHRQTDWTAGCVAVTNGEIEEIWSMVAIGTKVEIRP